MGDPVANKKRQKGSQMPKTAKQGVLRNPLAVSKEEQQASADRVTSIVQRLLKPPESLMAHCQRVGVPFWVAPMGIDEDGKHYARPCLIVPYDDMIEAELGHLASGGDMAAEYSDEATRKAGAQAAGRAVKDDPGTLIRDLNRDMQKMSPELLRLKDALQGKGRPGNSATVVPDDEWPTGSVQG
jgi:hypothetical protein